MTLSASASVQSDSCWLLLILNLYCGSGRSRWLRLVCFLLFGEEMLESTFVV